ncbi:MAG: peptidylprolyl isomerase [Alphaproteobacteria bacterium]
MMKTLFGLFLAAGVLTMTTAAEAGDPVNTLYMQLESGRVVIEMRPDLAPLHVERIRELTRQKFYDGVVFHRVIDGFMAQTGDPTGTGSGGSGEKIRAEFSPPSKAKHIRGVVSMARAQSRDSADSQFFICFKASPFLDGQYTIWGQVVEGMDLVDKIKKGDEGNNGKVTEPDHIVTMRVAADVKE